MTSPATLAELRNRALVLSDALEETGDMPAARRIRAACEGRCCRTCAHWWSADKMREAAEWARSVWLDDRDEVVSTDSEWEAPDVSAYRRYRVAPDVRVTVGQAVALGADGYIRPIVPDSSGDGLPMFGFGQRYNSLCRRTVTRGSGNVVSSGPVDMPMPEDGWCHCHQTAEQVRAEQGAEIRRLVDVMRTFRDGDGEPMYAPLAPDEPEA